MHPDITPYHADQAPGDRAICLKRWCAKAREIQWDDKNPVKRKGKLERLT